MFDGRKSIDMQAIFFSPKSMATLTVKRQALCIILRSARRRFVSPGTHVLQKTIMSSVDVVYKLISLLSHTFL